MNTVSSFPSRVSKAISVFLVLFITLSALPSHAQYFDWEGKFSMGQDEFVAYSKEMRKRGFKPNKLSATNRPDGTTRYATVWQLVPNDYPWECWLDMMMVDYLDKLDKKARDGWTPVDLSVRVTDGRVLYSAICSRNSSPLASLVFTRVPASRLKSTIDSCLALGYTPVDLDGYVHVNKMFYTAIFRQFTSGALVYAFGDTENEYIAHMNNWATHGYSPITTNVFSYEGQLRYSAVLSRAGNEAWDFRTGYNQADFLEYLGGKIEQGYALVDLQEYVSNEGVFYSSIVKKAPSVPNAASSRVSGSQPSTNPVTLTTTPYTGAHRVLSIAPVQQQTPVWCWLAVGEMIMKHLGIPNRNPGGNYQCGILGTIAGNTPCAINCFDAGCIIPSGSNHSTIRMLREYTWQASKRLFNAVEARELSVLDIQANINAGKPILCGVSPSSKRDNGSAEHVVLLVGYNESLSGIMVIVNDPFPYSVNANPYLLSGGRMLRDNQYQISLKDFTSGLFWHWSLSNIELG